MKTINIRQLHDETGRWVRRAAVLGGLQITEQGRLMAQLPPVTAVSVPPYFTRRTIRPAFKAVRLAAGTDSAAGISAERDER